MSSKRLKRPLEPDCEPSVQLVSESDDDLCSPECLLSMQPVEDDYSSDDDEARKKNETTKKRSERKVILARHSKSTQFTGPQVLFLFDLVYKPQPPPVDMADFLVVQILEKILTFVYKDADSVAGDPIFRKGGRTALEIYSFHLVKYDWLSWMKDNDEINLKKCSAVDFKGKMGDILTAAKHLGKKDALRFHLLEIREFLMFLRKEYVENGCKNRDSWKYMFTHLQRILKFSDPELQSYISLRKNGEAVYDLHYTLPTHLVSGCSQLSEVSDIKIYPDSVYGTSYTQHDDYEIGKIVLEVYDPKAGSSPIKDEVTMHATENETITNTKQRKTSGNLIKKPERTTDAILLNSYRTKATEYLRQSIPSDCRDYHTANQLTGPHVLQLIGLADELFQKQIIDRNEDDDRTNVKKRLFSSPVYRPIGMFLKNEYIIFSKLKINQHRLISYSKPAGRTLSRTAEEGVVSFSNWRLDVMEPSHRIALIVALLEILKPEEFC